MAGNVGPAEARLQRHGRARSRSRRSFTRPACRGRLSGRCSSRRRAWRRLDRVPHVAAVTLTGSTPAGRAVAAKAGAVPQEDASSSSAAAIPTSCSRTPTSSAAAETCAASRLINGGQSCIAAKRFVVVEPVRRAFEERSSSGCGPAPWATRSTSDTDVGPQARADLRDELHRQVEASVARGARVRLGCSVPEGPGAFYPPTRPRRTSQPGMPAFDEELFGPVAAVVAREATRRTRSGSPTRRSSASAPPSSRATWRAASASPATSSRPAPASSTRSSARTRACPSAGSGSPATAGSWARSGSGSS